MEKLKHFSLFSGIESFKKALTNLGIENDLVGYSEIDKYASVALPVIHGVSEELNYGDIAKIDEKDVPDCDLITYGFPCQDISIAGLGKGIVEGKTRSGLLYDALRIIKYKKPKYAISENVKNLVGKRFKDDFNSLLEELDSYGYNNYWKVLNAKDYGIPQNRERVFIVSIRKDIDTGDFKFPEPFDSGLRLKDLLEDEVEEKYYMSDLEIIRTSNWKAYQRPFKRVLGDNSISPTLTARGAGENHSGMIIYSENNKDTVDCDDDIKVQVKEATRLGAISSVGDSVSNSNDAYATRASQLNNILEHDYKIRKLTPLECWRLMGFTDKDYWKTRQILEDRFYDGKGRSDRQMYKMAGNSIVVDVLEGIFRMLLCI